MTRINKTYSQTNIYPQHCGVDTGYPSSGKEKDSETGLSYFGARYYEPEMLNIWLSVDPMADKYPSLNPYNYCAWNPIMLVDPDGNDWYESNDGKQLAYFHGKTNEIEGYKYLGENVTNDMEDDFISGKYSNIYISAEFQTEDFVSQEPGKCCAAANKMRMKRGGKSTSYANELPVVSIKGTGRAGESLTDNFIEGLSETASQLVMGIPVVAGMDYKDGSPNNDGITDHYVAITSISMDFSVKNGNIILTGGFLGYANPGSQAAEAGLSPNNRFSFGLKRIASNSGNRILSTLRVKGL